MNFPDHVNLFKHYSLAFANSSVWSRILSIAPFLQISKRRLHQWNTSSCSGQCNRIDHTATTSLENVAYAITITVWIMMGKLSYSRHGRLLLDFWSVGLEATQEFACRSIVASNIRRVILHSLWLRETRRFHLLSLLIFITYPIVFGVRCAHSQRSHIHACPFHTRYASWMAFGCILRLICDIIRPFDRTGNFVMRGQMHMAQFRVCIVTTRSNGN